MMGCFNNCSSHHRVIRQLIVLSMFLLILNLTHCRLMAQGRISISKQIDASEGQKENIERNIGVVRRSMIGSRPPRCNRKCNKCGHCEAVQIPVAAQLIKYHLFAKRPLYLYENPTIAYSRGDGITNYKPMSWKCKCGDLIFNP